MHRFCALQLLICGALFVWVYNSHCGGGGVAVRGDLGPSCPSEAEESDIIVVWFPPLLADGVFLSERGPLWLPLRQRCQPRIIPQPSPQEQNRISTIHFLFLWQNGIISKRQSLVVPAALEKSKDNHYRGGKKWWKRCSTFSPWLHKMLWPALTSKRRHRWTKKIDLKGKLAIWQNAALKRCMRDACAHAADEDRSAAPSH